MFVKTGTDKTLVHFMWNSPPALVYLVLIVHLEYDVLTEEVWPDGATRSKRTQIVHTCPYKPRSDYQDPEQEPYYTNYPFFFLDSRLVIGNGSGEKKDDRYLACRLFRPRNFIDFKILIRESRLCSYTTLLRGSEIYVVLYRRLIWIYDFFSTTESSLILIVSVFLPIW